MCTSLPKPSSQFALFARQYSRIRRFASRNRNISSTRGLASYLSSSPPAHQVQLIRRESITTTQMGNEQSIISQKHLVDPADARLVQQFREAQAANRVSEQPSSAQHQTSPPGNQPSDQRSDGEPAGAIMASSQRLSLSGQRETSSPSRRVSQRSSS